jgi:ribonucleotide reductase alpha subunit
MFQAATRSCSQGGVRNGAATLYYPVWHLEVEDLLVLKNNKGTEDNRVRGMDYGVQFNKLMYERLLTGGDITLFSPSDVSGLYDAFFADQDRFKMLYEKAEKNKNIRKKTIKAIDLFSAFMDERKNTGRIYLMNVDHANTHGSFIEDVAPIRQSNLCCEINLPTKPLNDLKDGDGEIALCTLSAINWGNIKQPNNFERVCTLAVRGLDALLSYQNYPVLAAQHSTMRRRPLGVATGIRNSTLMALMPVETSAQIANATNGIEPPRAYVSIKQSKDGVLKQVIPGIHKLKSKYELLWDQKSPEGYLKIMAVLQKYIDQGISVNTSYNPQHFPEEKIPMSTMIQHLLMFYKYGGKQLYYFNTFDGQGEVDITKLEDNAQLDDIMIEDEADCDSCVL